MRRRPQLADELRRVSAGRAEVCVTGSLRELREACGSAASRGVDLIAIVGGDGTTSATLSEVLRAYGEARLPQIALLRGGSMNTIATSLGVSSRPPRVLLERALQTYGGGAARCVGSVGTLRVGDRLGCLFGTGVWHGYLAETYRYGAPSRVTNAKVLGRVLASAAVRGETYARVACDTELAVRFADGMWEPRAYLSVAAGTVADAGFGFRPFHRARCGERAFHLLALKGTATDVLRELPRVWLGQGFDARTAHYAVTEWAELRSPSGGSFGYSIDGDIAVARGSLRLERGPVFRLLHI